MKKVLATTFAAIGLILASPVQAETGTISIPKPPQFKIEDLGLFVSRAINIALMIAAVLVFVYLVWGGIQWITSGGDKGKTEEARARITAALVGLAVVAAAWAVMLLVQYFFGLDVFGGATALPPAYE
jgi:hypothetical protein